MLCASARNLFPSSIYDNIRFACPSATQEEVDKAAKAALITAFSDELKHEPETQIGQNGAQFSGGQCQCISIAMAMLKNALILILDEAISALDGETERKMLDSIAGYAQGQTLLLITHQLKTAAKMQRILVVENGRVVESGTHDQLMQLNRVYCRLWSHKAMLLAKLRIRNFRELLILSSQGSLI